MRRLAFALALVCTASAGSLRAAAATPPTANVTVGIVNAISDAPIFIAEKKGYFADEGLVVTTKAFPSAANMVAPLGAGQLDVGAGSVSAGLYNAVGRGIKLRVVADKASSQPGYGVNELLISKAAMSSGRFKTTKDLKGLKIAMNGQGVTNQVTLNDILKAAGLKYADVQTVDLSFPEHVVALSNGAVDGGVTTEPSATAAIADGSAVKIVGDDAVFPGHQIANLLYSDVFIQDRRDVGMRFMRAYLRAVRFYNDALNHGKLAGPNAPEVINIITESTAVKDAALLRAITPNGCDPNGRVNVASLQHDLDFYREHGYVENAVTVESVVDNSFVEAALKSLGRYHPKAGAGK
jgi:NitT/TauT family transport system substrate-binding protein